MRCAIRVKVAARPAGRWALQRVQEVQGAQVVQAVRRAASEADRRAEAGRRANGKVHGAVLCVQCVLCLLSTGCSSCPRSARRHRAEEILGTVDSVSAINFSCGGRVLASDSLCAEVMTKDGARLRFDRVGFNSFGSTAVNVYVAEAGGLVPRIASCDGVSTPNFHRSSPLGHHFRAGVDRHEGRRVQVSRGARGSGVLAAVSAVLGSAGQRRQELSLLRASQRRFRRIRRCLQAARRGALQRAAGGLKPALRSHPSNRPTAQNTAPAARSP